MWIFWYMSPKAGEGWSVLMGLLLFWNGMYAFGTFLIGYIHGLVWGPAYFSWLVYYTTDMQITASLAGREAWFHFFICPLNFFCAGILQLPLGGMQGAVEGVVCGTAGGAGAGGCGGGGWWGGTGRRGGGCWGLCWARWRVWCEAPWGWVLGAVAGVLGGVVWGAVGAGAGSRGGGTGRGGGGAVGGGRWGLCWARWRVWCEAPWGWVLGAVAGRVKLVQSPPPAAKILHVDIDWGSSSNGQLHRYKKWNALKN